MLVVFRVFLGKLSDIIGRKPIMSAGIVLNTLAVVLYGFCNSVFQFLAAKSMKEIGRNVTSSVYDAIQADEFPKNVRKKYLRKIGTVYPVSRAMGVLLGFIISSYFTYVVGFYFAAVLVFIGGSTFLLFYKSSMKNKSPSYKVLFRFNFRKYNRQFILASFAGFIGSLSFTFVYYPAFFLRAKSVGFGTSTLFLLLFFGYTLSAILIHVFRKKIERTDNHLITTLGLFVMGVGTLGYYVVSAKMFVASLFLIIISYYVWRIGFKTYLYNATIPSIHGEQLGFAKTLDGIGTIMGPLMGGLIIETLSLEYSFLIAACIYFVGFSVLVLFGCKLPKKNYARSISISPINS